MRTCYKCGTGDRELRPYGPGGVDVCYSCAMSTTDGIAAAEEQLGKLLDAAPNLELGPQGPRPVKGSA